MVYDIFWKQSTGCLPVEYYEYDYIKFKPLASPPSPLMNEDGIDWEPEEGEFDDLEDGIVPNEYPAGLWRSGFPRSLGWTRKKSTWSIHYE